jgi:hypothetical protein
MGTIWAVSTQNSPIDPDPAGSITQMVTDFALFCWLCENIRYARIIAVKWANTPPLAA